jgi:acetyl esterase/lipase
MMKDPDHLMTIYTPSGTGPFPAMLAVHGGAWYGGGRDQGIFREEVARYASRGIAMFSVDYQLSTAAEPSWPTNIQDIVCALRHIKAHYGEYNIDPLRFGALGVSAGGHLVSLLGTINGDEAFIDGACGDPSISLKVDLVLNYSGPGDLEVFARAEGAKAGDAVAQMLGDEYDANPDLWRFASPATYVNSGDPPFVISHAVSDRLIPFESSSSFVEALRAVGIPVTFAAVEGGGHGAGLRLTMRVASEPEIERLLLAN